MGRTGVSDEVVVYPVEEEEADIGGEMGQTTAQPEGNCCSRNTRVWLYCLLGLAALYFIFCSVIGVLALRPDFPVYILLACLPALIFIYFGYVGFHRDKVSVNRVLLAVVVGILMFVACLIVEAILTFAVAFSFGIVLYLEFGQYALNYFSPGLPFAFGDALVMSTIAATVEETAKLLIGLIAAIPHISTMNPLGFAILCLTGTAVLATIENNEYIIGSFFSTIQLPILEGISVMVFTLSLRDLLSVPMHCFTAMIIGCSFAGSFLEYRNNTPTTGKFILDSVRHMIFPIFVHGSFDFILILTSTAYQINQHLWVFIFDLIVIGLVVAAGVVAIRKWTKLVPISCQPSHLYGRVASGDQEMEQSIGSASLLDLEEEVL